MTSDERTDTTNAYALANLIDVACPDSQDSAGARFLVNVASNLDELRDRVRNGEDASDVAWENGDASTPVYTHNVWQVYVDLCAYNEADEIHDEYGTSDEAVTTDAMRVLCVLAERLTSALLAEYDDEDDEDSECGMVYPHAVHDDGTPIVCTEHDDSATHPHVARDELDGSTYAWADDEDSDDSE